MQMALIAVFGIAGVFSRYGLDRLLPTGGSQFPVSTFAINLLGSLLAGMVFALGEKASITPELQTAIIVGFCGGFTTMSAFALQSALMVGNERVSLALIYLVATPALSFACALLGLNVIRRFVAQ